MTQLQHAPRRATALVPALVAATFMAAVAMTGVFLIGQPGGLNFGAAPAPKADTSAAVASGAIWQAQYEQQSLYAIRLNRAKDAAVASGAVWQAQYEQQSLDAIRLNGAKGAAVERGQEWQERQRQTKTIR
jgi:hypothetical protein